MNWENNILANQFENEPKVIFNEFCNEIGKHYFDQGFKYFKSKPRIERLNGDISQVINFWSSRNNEKGKSIKLELLPYLKSKSLKSWIKEFGIGRNEYLFAPKIKPLRNIQIFDIKKDEFKDLIKNIDFHILKKLDLLNSVVLDKKQLLNSNQFDNDIILDNFVAYLCMIKSPFLDEFLYKHRKIFDENIKSKIENYLDR